MIQLIKHFLRYIKFFAKHPFDFFVILFSDIIKDLKPKLNKENHSYFIWCAGLPKSGTTLIEEILEYVGYIDQKSSPLRIYDEKNLDHPHGISDAMFQMIPKNKFSFIKTHTHFHKNYEKIFKKYNPKIIISLRDLRDAMISDYYHTFSNKLSAHHNKIKKLDFEEGFKILLLSTENSKENRNINYYYNWILNWLENAKKENYLILWYEDYLENPQMYIQKILNHLNINHIKAEEVERKLEKTRNKLKKNTLAQNLKLSKHKTFSNEYKKGRKNIFTDEINNFFLSNLPDSIEKVLRKNK